MSGKDVIKVTNQVKVRIYGKEYALSTEESEVYTQKIANILNQKLDEVVNGAASLTKLDAAVLVALGCVDESVKSKANVDNIRTQIKEYVDDAGEARIKCDEAQKEIRKLKERITQLEKEVEVRKALDVTPSETKSKKI